MNRFINKYSLSKTLRFELEPIGKTIENIQNKGLLIKDEQLAESYKKMKKTIDGFHKYFIELAMQNVRLTKLEAFADLYFASPERKKDEKFKEELKKVQDELRKEIAHGFKTGAAKEIFSKLDKKELITQLLENWINTQPEKPYFDESFKTFTTYFGGFFENRKNIYSDKEQSTAIAYRMIHENLPKFLDNIRVFGQIKNIPELYENANLLFQEIKNDLNINSIDEAFELKYFNEVLTQKQIDLYNLIIGGRVPEEGKSKIRGLNEYVNLYNQKQKDKSKKVPKFKMLYKQILSDREKTSFVPEKFQSSEEVTSAINSFYHCNVISFQPKDKPDAENILEKIQDLLAALKDYDLNKIYLRNDSQLTFISQKIFGNYAVLGDALNFYYDNVMHPGYEMEYKSANERKKKKLEEEKQAFIQQDYLSIGQLQDALDKYIPEIDDSVDWKRNYTTSCIADYFKNHFNAEKKEGEEKEFTLPANISAKYSCVKGLLENYPKDRELYQDKKAIDNIKLFLDALLELLHFIKPLILRADIALEKDAAFYGQLEPWYDSLKELIPLYNKVRNYATQKPYSIEKFKLNFENSTLLDGWDVNKEEDNSGILFIKDGHYYLGIMDKKHNKIFRDIPKATSERTYRKINYKLLPGASKMLPKVFFSAKNTSYFSPDEEILRIRNHGTHTKNGDPQKGYEKLDFNLNDCHKMIDFFKSSIQKHKDWKNFGFRFSPTYTYDSIDAFYREVEAQGYNITFTEIDESIIDRFVEEGKLYLFRIHNKDFSPFSKGRPNLHTLYWKAIFSPENLKNVIYKLNGQAEVFYRRKSIQPEQMVIHKSGEAIDNKNPLTGKKQSTFHYDLIKDKRYTVDKFQFHVPITLNFKASESNFINYEVLQYLRTQPDVHIIGLDRGERNLIYLSLINQKGELLYQEPLNALKSDKFNVVTNYQELLARREKERDMARKSWGTIENIKELKEGYLSGVVNKIATLMVKHNAILVMEDLNTGFKRGRFKIERQVYQKLEKMLIDKLNYLVFKDKSEDEPGGLFKALQLTNKFKSFKEIGKQNGFIFYVPAWNTSKIDPTTGFVNLFYIHYENMEKARAFFGKFQSISYNHDKGYFEFAFDYNDFTTKAEGCRTNWTVCTHGDRIRAFRNPEKNHQWDYKTIHITEEFMALFRKYGIEFSGNKDLREIITGQKDAAFYKSLLDLFRLTLQMRNTNQDWDYLISPVLNENGEFYDSRKADNHLPQDADANGAFHIAKKGLMWLKQIQQFEGDNWKKLDLDKTNKGWLRFAQGYQF